MFYFLVGPFDFCHFWRPALWGLRPLRFQICDKSPRAHWSGSKSSQFDFLSATRVFEDNKDGCRDGSSVFWLSTRIRTCLFVPLILFCWRILIHFSLEYRVWLPQLAEQPAVFSPSFFSFLAITCNKNADCPSENPSRLSGCDLYFIYMMLCVIKFDPLLIVQISLKTYWVYWGVIL